MYRATIAALLLVACGAPQIKLPPDPPLPADIAGGTAFEDALVSYKTTWRHERIAADIVISVIDDDFGRPFWTVISVSGGRVRHIVGRIRPPPIAVEREVGDCPGAIALLEALLPPIAVDATRRRSDKTTIISSPHYTVWRAGDPALEHKFDAYDDDARAARLRALLESIEACPTR